MRASTAAKILLIIGAVVGGAAGVALALGFRVDQFPPWTITVGMYKLAFVAAAGLLTAGALLGRAARKEAAPPIAPLDASPDQPIVRAGPWTATERKARHADPVDRDGRQASRDER